MFHVWDELRGIKNGGGSIGHRYNATALSCMESCFAVCWSFRVIRFIRFFNEAFATSIILSRDRFDFICVTKRHWLAFATGDMKTRLCR
jgi:hypothetical protein